MIDTNVLVYVLSEEPDKTTEPLEHEKWIDCRALVAKIGIVTVSAIVWFEAYHAPMHDGSILGTRLTKVSKHIEVDPVDVAVAERAGRLVADIGQTLCPKCLAHAEAKKCPGCNKLVGKALRLNDAMIVAHADERVDVTHLYTYDDKMLKLDDKTRSNLTIAEPPRAPGVSVTSKYGRLVVDGADEEEAETPEPYDSGDSRSIPLVLPVAAVVADEPGDDQS